jgi:hypothetical protein
VAVAVNARDAITFQPVAKVGSHGAAKGVVGWLVGWLVGWFKTFLADGDSP